MSWAAYGKESSHYSPAANATGSRFTICWFGNGSLTSLNVFLVAFICEPAIGERIQPSFKDHHDNGSIRISGSAADTAVAVCICTFRRPAGLRRLLAGLASQTFNDIPHPVITVIVADNEGSLENRRVCSEFQESAFESLIYVHEQRQGISYARNACIDNLPDGTKFVAMVDDDESPDPAWLNHLLLAHFRSGADVVVGPTLPEFDANTASWVQDTGYFAKPQNPDSYEDLQADPPAATCNVLVNAEIFSKLGLRFDSLLALSGGEDKLLFQDIKLRGYKFVWAARARVTEWIPAERANIAYMWREEFRRASVRHYVKSRLKVSNPLKLLVLVPKSLARAVKNIAAGCYRVAVQLLKNPTNRSELALGALVIADGCGSIAGLLGLRSRHYRR
ncbi:MAG: glycosyltransferase family 2 protein [Thiogranum sp.]